MHTFSRRLSPLLALLQAYQRQLFEHPQNRDSDDSVVGTPHWVPDFDILEETDRFLIRADLPGVDPAQIEVQMEGDTLSIKGARVFENQEDAEQHGERFSRIERGFGRFHRRFVLPDTVDAERITANSNNGVLVVSIPKCQEGASRRIKVSSQRN